MMNPDEFSRFILANTAILSPPHVPEIRLRLADEAMYRHKRNRLERPRQIRRTA